MRKINSFQNNFQNTYECIFHLPMCTLHTNIRKCLVFADFILLYDYLFNLPGFFFLRLGDPFP